MTARCGNSQLVSKYVPKPAQDFWLQALGPADPAWALLSGPFKFQGSIVTFLGENRGGGSTALVHVAISHSSIHPLRTSTALGTSVSRRATPSCSTQHARPRSFPSWVHTTSTYYGLGILQSRQNNRDFPGLTVSDHHESRCEGCGLRGNYHRVIPPGHDVRLVACG